MTLTNMEQRFLRVRVLQNAPALQSWPQNEQNNNAVIAIAREIVRDLAKLVLRTGVTRLSLGSPTISSPSPQRHEVFVDVTVHGRWKSSVMGFLSHPSWRRGSAQWCGCFGVIHTQPMLLLFLQSPWFTKLDLGGIILSDAGAEACLHAATCSNLRLSFSLRDFHQSKLSLWFLRDSQCESEVKRNSIRSQILQEFEIF